MPAPAALPFPGRTQVHGRTLPRLASYSQVPWLGLFNRVRLINQNNSLRTLTSKETTGVFPGLLLLSWVVVMVIPPSLRALLGLSMGLLAPSLGTPV